MESTDRTKPVKQPAKPERPTKAAERLRSPRKSRPRVIIAPSTNPGPDIRISWP